MSKIMRRTIIVLKGISRKDLIPEEVEINPSALYSPLPRRFESPASWPQSTNLRCWHCDLVIEGPPAFLPLNFEMNGGEYQCNTEGVFNRWGCVVAYIDYTFSGNKRDQARQTTKTMCSRILGRPIQYIQPAPPRTKMLPYGGDLTEDQYLREIPI